MNPHEWTRLFVRELRLLRPHLTDEMLEVIAVALRADGDPKLAARSYNKRIQQTASVMLAAKPSAPCSATMPLRSITRVGAVAGGQALPAAADTRSATESALAE